MNGIFPGYDGYMYMVSTSQHLDSIDMSNELYQI